LDIENESRAVHIRGLHSEGRQTKGRVSSVQDRYTGDVGDFGKYGLLKALCGGDLSLGVVWYLVPDEDRPGDGAHIRYLDPTPTNLRRFRDCDPPLYDVLGDIVRSGRRRVASVREHEVLPEGTVFYDAPLSFDGTPGIGPAATSRRLEYREAWVRGALAATRGCDVVFADPDNGLESGIPRNRVNGPKFAYFDELVPYLDRDQSLVVYHHLNRERGTTWESQVRERLLQVGDRLGKSFALLYRPYAVRAFFVVPSEARREALFERASRFVRDPHWSQHFTLVEPEDFDLGK
jgi:hypothetical protein